MFQTKQLYIGTPFDPSGLHMIASQFHRRQMCYICVNSLDLSLFLTVNIKTIYLPVFLTVDVTRMCLLVLVNYLFFSLTKEDSLNDLWSVWNIQLSCGRGTFAMEL